MVVNTDTDRVNQTDEPKTDSSGVGKMEPGRSRNENLENEATTDNI